MRVYMLDINEYRQIRKDYFGETFAEASDGYYKYKAHKLRNSLVDFVEATTGRTLNNYQQKCIKDMKAWPKKDNSPTKKFDASLSIKDFEKARDALVKANVPTANIVSTFPINWTVPVKTNWFGFDCQTYKQQEGINPMRSYNDTYASASISNPQSDVAQQREYLKGQLNSAVRTKTSTFSNLFNLYVDNTPKSYKDMIDAITGGKYTIDPKFEKRIENWDTEGDGPMYFGPLAGIVWDGPKSDFPGFEAAKVEADKQKTIAERIIVTGDAAAGLAALEAFEAWQPTVATTTAN